MRRAVWWLADRGQQFIESDDWQLKVAAVWVGLWLLVGAIVAVSYALL